MVTVDKVDLDSGIKRNAELFNKARLEQVIAENYQIRCRANKTFEKSRNRLKIISLLGLILFIPLTVVLLILQCHFFLVVIMGVTPSFFCFFVFLTESISSSFDKSYHREMGKLLTEQAVGSRKAILENEVYHLAWIHTLRVKAFNIAFDQLTSTSSESWNEWAKGRMTRWHQDLMEEVKASAFYCTSVRDLALVCTIDRLRKYMELSPDEFERIHRVL